MQDNRILMIKTLVSIDFKRGIVVMLVVLSRLPVALLNCDCRLRIDPSAADAEWPRAGLV